MADNLKLIAQGDEQALATFFAEIRPRLARIAHFRLDPRLAVRIDVEDLLQESYLAAVKRIEHCDTSTEESVFIWFRMILQQTLIDLHRRHLNAAGRTIDREVRADQAGPDPDTSGCLAQRLEADISSPSKGIRRSEMKERLLMAINQMEPLDREVLALRHFEELSNTEVAETLNVSVKAASIRYVRALKKLKTILDDLSETTFSM